MTYGVTFTLQDLLTFEADNDTEAYVEAQRRGRLLLEVVNDVELIETRLFTLEPATRTAI